MPTQLYNKADPSLMGKGSMTDNAIVLNEKALSYIPSFDPHLNNKMPLRLHVLNDKLDEDSLYSESVLYMKLPY